MRQRSFPFLTHQIGPYACPASDISTVLEYGCLPNHVRHAAHLTSSTPPTRAAFAVRISSPQYRPLLPSFPPRPAHGNTRSPHMGARSHDPGSRAASRRRHRADKRPRRALRPRRLPGVDDYAWIRADNWREVLRDPAALPADIRALLEAENAYADADARADPRSAAPARARDARAAEGGRQRAAAGRRALRLLFALPPRRPAPHLSAARRAPAAGRRC